MRFDYHILGLFHSATIECKDKSEARSLLRWFWRHFVMVRPTKISDANRRFVKRINPWEPVTFKNIVVDAAKIAKRRARSANAAGIAAAVRAQREMNNVHSLQHDFVNILRHRKPANEGLVYGQNNENVQETRERPYDDEQINS